MCETRQLKDTCEVLFRGCWSKGSLEVFFFFSLSIILQKNELSFLFHAESLST